MSDDNPDSTHNGQVEISGNKCLPDISCRDLLVTGAVCVSNSINAHSADITGTLVVEGPFIVNELTVTGSVRVTGELAVQEATITGSILVEGGSKIDLLVVNGKGEFVDLEVEKLIMPNGITASEVSAENIKLENGDNVPQ